MKQFGLIGTAGYVAPRHLKAIKDSGHNLMASMDLSDSVGIIDRYFPRAEFFTDFPAFAEYLHWQKSQGKGMDYLSLCTPNHTHFDQIKFGMEQGAAVICEKPIVVEMDQLEILREVESKTGKKVYTILQLRLLESLQTLKAKIQKDQAGPYDVVLSYITPRGKWYHESWKGKVNLSGGIITNIGIHLFDLMIWLFGEVKEVQIMQRNKKRASGYIILENAKVKWYLSIDKNDLPQQAGTASSYRSIDINGQSLEFSQGFENLHTKSYEMILNGQGFDIDAAYPSIQLVNQLRTDELSNNSEKAHPLCQIR